MLPWLQGLCLLLLLLLVGWSPLQAPPRPLRWLLRALKMLPSSSWLQLLAAVLLARMLLAGVLLAGVLLARMLLACVLLAVMLAAMLAPMLADSLLLSWHSCLLL